VRNPFYGLLLIAWAMTVSLPGAENTNQTAIEQACSATNPGTTAATFSWPPAYGAHQVWLDLSVYDNNFAGSSFVGVGPFNPNATSYTWQGLQPGLQYYYRVHALYSDGWHALKLGSFVSGRCGGEPAIMQSVEQQCSMAYPGKVATTFNWAPSLLPSSSQWLDLTPYNTGFAPGTFAGAGPLPSGQSSYTWDGLEPGMTYYWRVNTQAPDGWRTSPPWSFGTLSCGAVAPLGVAPNANMLGLRDRLDYAIGESSFNVAVSVTDLQTGESVDVKGDDPRHPGCTFNWFVILSSVIDLQEGRYPESGAGDLITRTIYGSNPITARTLLLKTGGDVPGGVYKINSLLTRLGMRNSVFDHPPAYPEEFSLRGWPNVITANDANRALTLFYHGGVVNQQWRDYLLVKMQNVKPGLQYLIPAGVGDGLVSHKNGFTWMSSGYVDNDIGIVQFETSGGTRAYAISLYIQDIAVEYADVSIGQTVSRLAWEYFSNRYQ